jgi:pseudoazurin
MISRLACIAALALAVFGHDIPDAAATEHVVKMRNNNGKGKFMLFEPDVVKAAVGDTVKFVPADRGHNAEAIPEIWPEGAGEFKGEINQEAVLTLDKAGIYGIKCLPHYPMGMMALIVAGEPANAAQLDSYKPSSSAEKRFLELKAQVKP